MNIDFWFGWFCCAVGVVLSIYMGWLFEPDSCVQNTTTIIKSPAMTWSTKDV